MHGPRWDPERTERRSSPATGCRTDHVDSPPGRSPPDATTRRHLLIVSGGVLAGSALSNPASAAHERHYEIGAQTSHWAGEEPSEIAGQENPTLTMTVGEEYTVTWHNRDGNYHRLLIRNGDNEVLARSPGNNEAGGMESVTFVVTEEMDNYQCEPHYSMNGNIETRDAQSSTATAASTPNRTGSPSPTRTETGTATGTSTPTDASAPETASGTATAASTNTATATEVGEPATTVDGTPTETASLEDDPDDQPLFGVGSLLAGLGGVGYLLRRRFRDGDD